MKYKASRMAVIFFMTSFNRDGGGGHGPLVPSPWIRSCPTPIFFYFSVPNIQKLAVYFTGTVRVIDTALNFFSSMADSMFNRTLRSINLSALYFSFEFEVSVL